MAESETVAIGADNWLDPIEWVPMTFDPELQVNVRGTIMVMRGEVATLTRDDWLDVKEQTADMLEQFIVARRRIAELEQGLRLCNEELAKAYEHGAQYQDQAAEMAARLPEQ